MRGCYRITRTGFIVKQMKPIEQIYSVKSGTMHSSPHEKSPVSSGTLGFYRYLAMD